VRPAIDDKALADWNGLTIAALAFAGSSLGRTDWITLASDAFHFVTTTMMRGDRLAHAWRDGRSVYPGLASDYAAMIKAALALYAATLDRTWIDKAEGFAATARAHHWDAAEPGYFLSADDAEALIVRPKATADEATPGATSTMAQNLVRLWRLTGNYAYRDDVDAILTASAGAIANNLFATTGLLNALDLRMGAVDVVIVTSKGSDRADLIAAARRHATPNTVLSVHEDEAALPANHPAAGKTAVEERATAYVCRGETCSLPVTDGDSLARLLA
jgi:uncharacterized protein YyaL (SSP411 family)